MYSKSPGFQVKPRRIAYSTATQQFGELYLPNGAFAAEPFPVVILIHGGYWRARYDLKLMNGLARDLVARGYAAWNIEYRRVGDAGGGWPGTLLDVASAVDHLRAMAPTYHLDQQRVVATGHSAGGHLAFWLAARGRIPTGSPLASAASTGEPLKLAGAISLAGVLDLEMAWKLHLSNDAVVELLGKAWPDAPERYAAASPAALLPLGVAQVVLHGTQDAHVPIEISRDYAAAARDAGDAVEYIEMEGVDHFELIDPHSAAWGLTIEALVRMLEKQS